MQLFKQFLEFGVAYWSSIVGGTLEDDQEGKEYEPMLPRNMVNLGRSSARVSLTSIHERKEVHQGQYGHQTGEA
jgi:hypothetical protein